MYGTTKSRLASMLDSFAVQPKVVEAQLRAVGPATTVFAPRIGS